MYHFKAWLYKPGWTETDNEIRLVSREQTAIKKEIRSIQCDQSRLPITSDDLLRLVNIEHTFIKLEHLRKALVFRRREEVADDWLKTYLQHGGNEERIDIFRQLAEEEFPYSYRPLPRCKRQLQTVAQSQKKTTEWKAEAGELVHISGDNEGETKTTTISNQQHPSDHTGHFKMSKPQVLISPDLYARSKTDIRLPRKQLCKVRIHTESPAGTYVVEEMPVCEKIGMLPGICRVNKHGETEIYFVNKSSRKKSIQAGQVLAKLSPYSRDTFLNSSSLADKPADSPAFLVDYLPGTPNLFPDHKFSDDAVPKPCTVTTQKNDTHQIIPANEAASRRKRKKHVQPSGRKFLQPVIDINKQEMRSLQPCRKDPNPLTLKSFCNEARPKFREKCDNIWFGPEYLLWGKRSGGRKDG